MSEAYIALIGTMFGGAGFKVIEFILGRKSRKEDFATNIRSELRDEVAELRKEADKLHKEAAELRAEIDKWRSKYYSLVSSIAKGDLREAQRKIQEK